MLRRTSLLGIVLALCACGESTDFVPGQLPKCNSSAAKTVLTNILKQKEIKLVEMRNPQIAAHSTDPGVQTCRAELSTSEGVFDVIYTVRWADEARQSKNKFLVEAQLF